MSHSFVKHFLELVHHSEIAEIQFIIGTLVKFGYERFLAIIWNKSFLHVICILIFLVRLVKTRQNRPFRNIEKLRMNEDVKNQNQ